MGGGMSALLCPCCGQLVTEAVRDPKVVLDIVHLSPIERRIAEALARRLGHWWLTDDLVNAVYADDANGGPEHARQVVDVGVWRLKRQLADTPLLIEGIRGRGGGRRMVWRAAA
jgi:DNA-binding response OmpR family regulator